MGKNDETRYFLRRANIQFFDVQCAITRYKNKKEGERRKENLDKNARMSDTGMVIAYSPVGGIFKTRAGTRAGNRVDEELRRFPYARPRSRAGIRWRVGNN